MQKNIIIGLLVIIACIGIYISVNLERIFIDSSPVVMDTNDSDMGEKEESSEAISKGLTRVNIDNIDLPFVDDPQVIGTWKSVDFVKVMDDFNPKTKSWQGMLYLDELILEADGNFDVEYFKWTKGKIMHLGDKTAADYFIEEIDGEAYMYFQWKSGDYVYRDMTPMYYVLRKEK